MAERRATRDKRPLKFLLLDDWVGSGDTARRTRHALKCLGKVRLLMGTMYGNHLRETVDRHVVGSEDSFYASGWVNNPVVFGVDYPNTGPHPGVVPEIRRTERARELRRDLAEAVKAQIEPSPHSPMSAKLVPHSTWFQRTIRRLRDTFS